MYEKTFRKISRLSAHLAIAMILLTTTFTNLSAENLKSNRVQRSDESADGKNVLEINPKSGSVMKQIIGMPAYPVLNLANYNAISADVDLQAFDMKG